MISMRRREWISSPRDIIVVVCGGGTSAAMGIKDDMVGIITAQHPQPSVRCRGPRLRWAPVLPSAGRDRVPTNTATEVH